MLDFFVISFNKKKSICCKHFEMCLLPGKNGYYKKKTFTSYTTYYNVSMQQIALPISDLAMNNVVNECNQ